jgi:hypothetical protein
LDGRATSVCPFRGLRRCWSSRRPKPSRMALSGFPCLSERTSGWRSGSSVHRSLLAVSTATRSSADRPRSGPKALATPTGLGALSGCLPHCRPGPGGPSFPSWGFPPLQRRGRGGPHYPGLPHPARSALGVSHPLDGFLPPHFTASRAAAAHGVGGRPVTVPTRRSPKGPGQVRDVGASRPSALRNRRSSAPRPRGWAPVPEHRRPEPLSPPRSHSGVRRPKPPSAGAFPRELRRPKPRRSSTRGVGDPAAEAAFTRRPASGLRRRKPRRPVGARPSISGRSRVRPSATRRVSRSPTASVRVRGPEPPPGPSAPFLRQLASRLAPVRRL